MMNRPPGGPSRNFRVPETVLEDLETEAGDEHTTVAELIRRVLLAHTRAWRKKKGLEAR